MIAFKPSSGYVSEYIHNAPEGASGRSGETVMGGGSLGKGKLALGALIRVRCDTVERTIEFQVTDGQGRAHPAHLAMMGGRRSKRPIELPAVFAPYARLIKVGDA